MKKRIFTVLLVAMAALSLTSCGISKKYKNEVNGFTTYYFGEDEDLKNFPVVSDPLDPQKIYDSLEYTEKMFYGTYVFDGTKEDFLEKTEYMPLDYISYGSNKIEKDMFSTMPSAIRVGAVNSLSGQKNREHEWAEVFFMTEEGLERDVICTYTVSENTITFTPVAQYEIKYNDENKAVGLAYELGTNHLSYTFSFKGPNLTLSNETKQVTLCSTAFTGESISFSGQVDPTSPSIEGVESILCAIYVKTFSQSSVAYLLSPNKDGEDAVYNYKKAASYREDGLLTLSWSHDDEYGKEIKELRQFVAFIGGSGSMILVDEKNIYYYTHSEDSYVLATISQGMTDEELIILDGMENSKVEQLVQKRGNLLKDLSSAFQDAGVSAKINETTGEIALDSTVLFGVNESSVSNEGKELLKKFMQVYTSVVFNEKYSGFVSRILVEGHTDTTGTYESNQKLSQNRADVVRDFCMSSEIDIDAAHQQQLESSLSAVGHSWDYPVYAKDGSVDMEASRRVSFRFIINLNQ